MSPGAEVGNSCAVSAATGDRVPLASTTACAVAATCAHVRPGLCLPPTPVHGCRAE